MQKTILLHVLTLLSLVAAALSGIEALARFMVTPQKFANPLGWLMLGTMILSLYIFFRLRKQRKKEFERHTSSPGSNTKPKNK